MNLLFRLSAFWVFLFISANAFSQAQGTQTTFGKNRVQYKDFDWFYHRSPSFDTYYYRGGKELAATVGRLAEQNLKDIENLLDYRLEGRIKILAYNKLSDVKQTNLGLQTDETSNTGGLTQIVGNKIFIYFDGNTYNLRKQVRAGIAQVLINNMLYGGSIQEMLQNSTLLVLPDWYIPGLVSYLAEDWNIESDNYMRDALTAGRIKKLNRFLDTDPRLSGHSVWKFIVDNYGTASISNILYMTRVNRNAESGFLYIVGLSFDDMSLQWLNYYQTLYRNSDNGKQVLQEDARIIHKNKKKTKKWNYSQFRISPDGKSYAYIINVNGRFKVYVYDMQNKTTKKVFTYGMKSLATVTENSDPVLTWHPSGLLLAIAYDKKSMATIQVVNTTNRKENFSVEMYKYEKIVDFSYSSNGRKWVLSAIKNGQSDIYVFDITSRRDEQITNDYFDDLHPRFIQQSNKIIFSSNRQADSLKEEKFSSFMPLSNQDLWIYDYSIRDNVLSRVTNTPFANETHPVEYDSTKVLYLSDANGINNRWYAEVDSVYAYSYDTTISWYDTTITVYRDTFYNYPASNYKRNILMQELNMKNKRASEIIFNNGSYQMYPVDLRNLKSDILALEPTPYRAKQKKLQEATLSYLQKIKKQARQDTTQSALRGKPITKDSTKIDINNYFFQNELPSRNRRKAATEKKPEPIGTGPKNLSTEGDKKGSLDDYFTKTPSPYIPIFSSNYVIAQLDNGLINTNYQLFTGTGPVFFNSQLNALVKFGASDLMEDYRFVGGFRLASDLTIPEYFISFENLKSRLDKQLIFYKSGMVAGVEGIPTEVLALRLNTYELKSILRYPFSEAQSLRLNTSFRKDEFTVLATSEQTLPVPNFNQNHISYKLEYVFDNTISTGLNLYNGSRYKLYVEQAKELDKKDKLMTNIGFDARHYEKLHRQIVLAARIAGATSVANEKVIYYLGGVDNWWFARFNSQTQIDFTQNYIYQAVATNMRGFAQNTRNGNSFTVINTEVRIPVFTYLLNRPIKSDFVKTFQVVPFFDLGSSWIGLNPFTKRNSENRITDINGPIKVTIKEPRFPIVAGFGAGLRSRILGYFMRFDLSYGIENGVIQRRVNYFSLSLDF